ncbi:MAG: GH1 family beta-glucosidase [Polyangiaceae bacterium]|nr:GH1 family beta-glucosidase [Polyangiaceae bacterium]
MTKVPGVKKSFPQNFIWGAAAAAYQIEGAAATDGKGASVWDMFCRRPGTVLGGDTGEVACDHYHRLDSDLDLMAQLGLQAYRFSLSWPRLLPQGQGDLNPKGVDFYERLIDGLLERGITPWATLFHWDYPLDLFHRGGWLSADSPAWFAEYAAKVVELFSDRVVNYFTLNEPQVFLGLGHLDGRHAPGLQLPVKEFLRAGHHSLLAHGKAVQAMRASAKQKIRIGYAPVGIARLPREETAEAIELARRATFEVHEENSWNSAWWMDPVYLGQYPEQGLRFFGRDVPSFSPEDLAIISQPLDFFGVNIYQGISVERDESELGWKAVDEVQGAPATALNWPLTPDALYWGPKFFYERYGLPIIITENGLSCRDWVSLDGQVHDPARIDYAKRYLRSLHRAGEDGTEISGYFHWSVMDNFEWAEGYRERFGLIHVDYQTQVRTPKDSFRWYHEVIESAGAAIFVD